MRHESRYSLQRCSDTSGGRVEDQSSMWRYMTLHDATIDELWLWRILGMQKATTTSTWRYVTLCDAALCYMRLCDATGYYMSTHDATRCYVTLKPENEFIEAWSHWIRNYFDYFVLMSTRPQFGHQNGSIWPNFRKRKLETSSLVSKYPYWF